MREWMICGLVAALTMAPTGATMRVWNGGVADGSLSTSANVSNSDGESAGAAGCLSRRNVPVGVQRRSIGNGGSTTGVYPFTPCTKDGGTT